MADDLFSQLVGMVFAGGGLLLAAGMNLLLRQTPWWGRAAVTLLVCGAAAGGVWTITGETRAVGRAGAVLAVGTGFGFIAGSCQVGAAAALLFTGLRRADVRWGLVAVAGLGIVCASAARYQIDFDADIDRGMAELESLTTPPATTDPADDRASTDRGTPVPIRQAAAPRPDGDLRDFEERILRNSVVRDHLIRRQPADDRANCHGWVFTGGRYWLGGAAVDQVLDENGYRPVSDPQPGDLVVYRTGSSVTHTAVVRYVAAGNPVLVEGKWGCIGVFVHPVDKSLYGTEFTYYRSPRRGHLLAGLGGPLASAAGVVRDADDPPVTDDFAE